MAEQFLYHPEIGAAGEEMGSKCVAERVRPDLPFNPDSPRVFHYYTADLPICQTRCALVQKQRTVRGVRLLFLLVEQALNEIGFQGIQRLSPDWDDPFLAAFAEDFHQSFAEVDVLDIQPFNFTDPQAARIQQFQERLVADRQQSEPFRFLNEAECIVDREK